MNKNQIILAAIGGTVAVGALVLGYFIWDASSAKAERAEALEDNLVAVGNIMKKLPMKPNTAELKVFGDSCASYADWRAEAQKVAARGDLVFEKTTPAEFKTTMAGDARKIADLPGCFNGKLVKPDFGFGFKDYVTGGAMPPEAELKRLQREWNDVAAVLRTIAACGGADAGIVDIRMGIAKSAQMEGSDEESAKPKSKRKAKRPRAKPEGEAEAQGENRGGRCTSCTVEFLTRPSGLVKTINAFATGTRFVVVEDFSFVREKDGLAEALGGDMKNSEPQASSSRRRRRASQQQDVAKVETKGGLVTDPATAPLLKVTMAISIHDFGSLEEETKDKVEGEEKGESK